MAVRNGGLAPLITILQGTFPSTRDLVRIYRAKTSKNHRLNCDACHKGGNTRDSCRLEQKAEDYRTGCIGNGGSEDAQKRSPSRVEAKQSGNPSDENDRYGVGCIRQPGAISTDAQCCPKSGTHPHEMIAKPVAGNDETCVCAEAYRSEGEIDGPHPRLVWSPIEK